MPCPVPLVVFQFSQLLCQGVDIMLGISTGTFGAKYMAGLTGRMLLGSASAVTIGPRMLAWNRSQSIESAISELAEKVDPAAFAERFGAPIEKLDDLVTAKVWRTEQCGRAQVATFVAPLLIGALCVHLCRTGCGNSRSIGAVSPRHARPNVYALGQLFVSCREQLRSRSRCLQPHSPD